MHPVMPFEIATGCKWYLAQVDYIVGNGWVPTLEFAEKDQAYAGTEFSRLHSPGHYTNRYPPRIFSLTPPPPPHSPYAHPHLTPRLASK